MKNSHSRFVSLILTGSLIVNVFGLSLRADAFEVKKIVNASSQHANNKYFFDPITYTYNTGKDNGFSKKEPIKPNDPHSGWQIGRFYIEGFTSVDDTNGKIVVLKNVGDQIKFGFQLYQDINCLNGDNTLSINDDENNTDTQLQVPKQDFGRGALFVKKTDYQQNASFPVEYINFLSACSVNAYTDITMYEEGNYSVALDYEIKDGRELFGATTIFGYSILPTYTDYRYAFDFEIRNSNCMAYPKDIKTNSDLYDGDRTKNGFTLDLAKSRYLDIYVKFNEIKNGRPVVISNTKASDGDKYEREGIYEISIENKSTHRSTMITLFVGDASEIITYCRKYRGEPEQKPASTSKPTITPTPAPTVTTDTETNTVDDTTEWLDSLDLNSQELQDYLKDAIYDDLVNEFDGNYYVENVEAVYISKDYLDELEYNSKTNVFFGYSLEELDSLFGDDKYVFEVNDQNQTTVHHMDAKANGDRYDKMIENCVVGGGVILICVVVSVATYGTAPAVSAIFAASAKTGAKVALSSSLISGSTKMLVDGYETKDFDIALDSAMLEGSEGLKWGAIIGSVSGGVSKAANLRGLMKGGLSMNEAARIQRETHWPSEVISRINSIDEYNIYKGGKLSFGEVANNKALLRKIDWDFKYNGLSNRQRVAQNLSPLGPDLKPYQLHHVGQAKDSPLAVLTWTEHYKGGNFAVLHTNNATTTAEHGAEWTAKRIKFFRELSEMQP